MLWRVGAPVFVAVTLPFLLTGIGPAVVAANGGGVRGTFTATRQECNRSCDWYGDFVSNDGTRHRSGVELGSGRHPDGVGGVIAALDTGDREKVFPAGGGMDWLYVTLLLLAELVAVVLWIRDVGGRVLRWLAARRGYPAAVTK